LPQLTQAFVKSVALLTGESQKFYMDDELIGFALRISKTKKTFYLQTRVSRRVVKRKIGEYGVLTVDQARKTALQMKAQLQAGVDPYLEKYHGAGTATLAEMFDEYIRDVIDRPATRANLEMTKKKFEALEGIAFKRKPNPRLDEEIELIKVKLPNWMNRPYREITQDDILGRFDVISRMLPKRRISKKPRPITRTANQHFKFLQAAYNYIISKHQLARKGFENPVRILKAAKRWSRANRRRSFLDVNAPYFVKWWNACESCEPHVIGDFILFTLVTASRSIESSTLRWSDVDLNKGTMVFRNTKNGEDYTFPIAPLARTILLRRKKEQINDFVFGYAESKKRHVMCPPQYHIKLIRAECGEHFTLHDLRRTFTTAMTTLNVHAFTIAHLMKHSSTITMTLSYAPPTREQLLEALVRLETYLLERVRPVLAMDSPGEAERGPAEGVIGGGPPRVCTQRKGQEPLQALAPAGI